MRIYANMPMCNLDSLEPHFYVVKLGFITGIHYFSQNTDFGFSLHVFCVSASMYCAETQYFV